MEVHEKEDSLRVWARWAGLLYLLIIVLGAVDHLVIRGSLIVGGDSIETAKNILGSPALWRLSIAGDIMMQVLDIPVMLALYLLFRSVNNRLALLALLLNVVQTAVLVANKQNLVQVVQLVSSHDPASAYFGQAADHAYLLIDLHDYGFSMGLIFFGLSCLLYGYLIFTSKLVPRVLGLMVGMAGICYLVSSFTAIVAPDIAGKVSLILVLSLIGELAFALWLIIKGVNLKRVKT